MIRDVAVVALTIVVLSPFAVAYVVGILLARRLVATWTGRDVMSRFRPHRRDVARAERELGVG